MSLTTKLKLHALSRLYNRSLSRLAERAIENMARDLADRKPPEMSIDQYVLFKEELDEIEKQVHHE